MLLPIHTSILFSYISQVYVALSGLIQLVNAKHPVKFFPFILVSNIYYSLQCYYRQNIQSSFTLRIHYTVFSSGVKPYSVQPQLWYLNQRL
jgi:hypothetical protein